MSRNPGPWRLALRHRQHIRSHPVEVLVWRQLLAGWGGISSRWSRTQLVKRVAGWSANLRVGGQPLGRCAVGSQGKVRRQGAGGRALRTAWGGLWKFSPEPWATVPKCGPPGDAQNMGGPRDWRANPIVLGWMPTFWVPFGGPHFLGGRTLFEVLFFGAWKWGLWEPCGLGHAGGVSLVFRFLASVGDSRS